MANLSRKMPAVTIVGANHVPTVVGAGGWAPLPPGDLGIKSAIMSNVIGLTIGGLLIFGGLSLLTSGKKKRYGR